MQPTRGLIGGPPAPLLGLAPDGVCRAVPVARHAGGLLPHRFTLACAPVGAIGGLLSVARSVWFPRPAVSRHPALWSPDFPQPCEMGRGRPANSPNSTSRGSGTPARGRSVGALLEVPVLAQTPAAPVGGEVEEEAPG